MGKSVHLDPQVTQPRHHPGSKDPTVVMTRDQFADVDDPARVARHYPEDTLCSRCDAVVKEQRWVVDPTRSHLLRAAGVSNEVLCPACRSASEQLPRGIVSLRGTFWPAHRDEILRMIDNEAAEAAGKNPMERVIATREEGEALVVETTNEKLAQRIGRRLESAYHGTLAYEWPDRNHLVRVDWQRDL
jgi:NMD protein affecting ribosome stability and mRNA decay